MVAPRCCIYWCRLARAFAARINRTQVVIWANAKILVQWRRLSWACANVQTHQSIRWSHIWQRKRISGQQESLVLIRLSSDKRLRWTCAALWIFTRALTRCSHKWHTHRRSSMHMGFWYCYEGSSEPVQMCRLTRTFASGTQISIWATTWYFGTVMNH